ncbi:uncharacterized protein LOC114321703 [Camellia sinensis]|uniref:uncharacterized protein LOC114321703 n=1 Tax=Camellia sinensis TaxID=4442 RepID=UPI00103610E1|nr:uncharacterized protein LOC114321703 [Camellia sinensis]
MRDIRDELLHGAAFEITGHYHESVADLVSLAKKTDSSLQRIRQGAQRRGGASSDVSENNVSNTDKICMQLFLDIQVSLILVQILVCGCVWMHIPVCVFVFKSWSHQWVVDWKIFHSCDFIFCFFFFKKELRKPGKASNNEAEYEALIAGLKLVAAMKADKVMVFCDS